MKVTNGRREVSHFAAPGPSLMDQIDRIDTGIGIIPDGADWGAMGFLFSRNNDKASPRKLAPLLTLTCRVCARDFQARHARARFCGSKCRQRRHRHAA